MGFDTAYEAITEADDDHRWAFGTGFADPFTGLDAALADGVDGSALAEYCVMLADDALVMSHRLQQWLTRAPELEEETALANIALDLLGQARMLYTRAGIADGSRRDEDAFAYLREAAQFRNLQFVEQRLDDFAVLTLRLFVFTTFRLAQFERLRSSVDPVIAAVAAKGVAELTYHRDYAADWVVRLGNGTEHSRLRVSRALSLTMPGVSELFAATPTESGLAAVGAAVEPGPFEEEVRQAIVDIRAGAGIPFLAVLYRQLPASGRIGEHTPELEAILDELQSVAREHAGATW